MGALHIYTQSKASQHEEATKVESKKHQDQFLGWSKNHTSTVALVRNLQMGSISPQFHIVTDDWFTTIAKIDTDDAFVVPDNWVTY
eukprot:7292940-Ditylum_brightwellii.AAC.2